tara:strand:+ start:331 stop:948 length:618 start_codon:yes stop_codon:yes gene_type:complete
MLPMFIDNIILQLQSELPGIAEQEKMLIKPRPSEYKLNKRVDSIDAAVLILLYPIDDQWYFFLTKRSEMVEHHKNQISFPGGIVHENELLWDAAARETYEEIGVQNITRLGSLTPLFVPVSNFHIHPFIGWVNEKPITKQNELEVEQILPVSIKELMLENIYREKKEIISSQSVRVPFFDLCNEMVWGATAAILSEFRFIIKSTK